MTFWDHLEELRFTIIRSFVAVAVLAIASFCFKEILFDGIVLAPTRGDFILYRLLGVDFDLKLVNIEISTQFMVHLRVALAAGLVLSFPYLIFEAWRFVAPALYEHEKKAVRKAFGLSSVLFYLGAAVGYFLVLPFCLNFFVSYQVSGSVENTISLNSYISLFTSLVLVIALVFEFPMVTMLLSSMGLVGRSTMRRFRKHAVVVILLLSAIITPADPLSMVVLFVPMYLLYEFSILICSDKVNEEK